MLPAPPVTAPSALALLVPVLLAAALLAAALAMPVLVVTGRPAPDRPFPAWSLLARVFSAPPLRVCPPLRESVGLLVNSSSLPRRWLLPGSLP